MTHNQTQQTRQNNTRRGPTLRPQRGTPGPHSGERRAMSPVLALFGRITYSGFPEKAWPQTQQKGKTKNHKSTEVPLPPHIQKGSSSPASSKRIPKTHGAQNGTPRKNQEKGRTAKWAINQQRRNKKKNHMRRVWGCPVIT